MRSNAVICRHAHTNHDERKESFHRSRRSSRKTSTRSQRPWCGSHPAHTRIGAYVQHGTHTQVTTSRKETALHSASPSFSHSQSHRRTNAAHTHIRTYVPVSTRLLTCSLSLSSRLCSSCVRRSVELARARGGRTGEHDGALQAYLRVCMLLALWCSRKQKSKQANARKRAAAPLFGFY